MARRYYIFRDGERLYRDTLQSISSLAKKEANKIGEAITVYFEDRGRSGSAVRHPPQAFHVSRNPAGKQYYIVTAIRGSGGHQEHKVTFHYDTKAAADNAVRILEGEELTTKIKVSRGPHFTRNPDPGIYADHAVRMHQARSGIAAARAKQSVQKYVVHVANRSESYTITRKGLAAAQRIAAQYEDAGYRVKIQTANPIKSKLTGSRGFYVEYMDGAKLARIKYANKGIATMRANAMKKDGWRKVRVLSA